MGWLVGLVDSSSVRDIVAVQELWVEYWRSLELSPGFQGFAEELRTLPGRYAAPEGHLLLARSDEEPAGTFAFRRLSEDACEAKRLYVRPAYRHRGVAGSLLAKVIEEAKRSGYQHLYCDTLPTMASALGLYRSAGFVEVSAYSKHPTPGGTYLRLSL